MAFCGTYVNYYMFHTLQSAGPTTLLPQYADLSIVVILSLHLPCVRAPPFVWPSAPPNPYLAAVYQRPSRPRALETPCRLAAPTRTDRRASSVPQDIQGIFLISAMHQPPSHRRALGILHPIAVHMGSLSP